MSRRQLPPPPPPEHLRTWPDRAALLADRARALEELHRRGLGLHRLVLLWLMGLLCLTGWTAVASAVQFASAGGFPDVVIAVFVGVIGLGIMTLGVILTVLGMRSDRRVRGLTDSWMALDDEPVSDARLRSPGLSLAWLLLSFVPCALGIWSSFGSAAAARPGADALSTVTLGIGAGLILWWTGLLGIWKAVAHRKWALGIPAVVGS